MNISIQSKMMSLDLIDAMNRAVVLRRGNYDDVLRASGLKVESSPYGTRILNDKENTLDRYRIYHAGLCVLDRNYALSLVDRLRVTKNTEWTDYMNLIGRISKSLLDFVHMMEHFTLEELQAVS